MFYTAFIIVSISVLIGTQTPEKIKRVVPWNKKLYLLDQEGKITNGSAGLLIFKGGTVCKEYFNFGADEGELACHALGFRRLSNIVPEMFKEFQKLYPITLDEDRCTFGDNPSCMFDMESGNFTADYTACLDHESDIWITCSNEKSEISNTCIAGMYMDMSTEKCQKCPANFYSNESSFSCFRCPRNTVSERGSSVCGTCPAGYYWEHYSCRKCSGEYFGNGVVCVECPDGTISSENNTMCIMYASEMSKHIAGVLDAINLVLIFLVLVIVAVYTAMKLRRYCGKIRVDQVKKEKSTEEGSEERNVPVLLAVPQKESNLQQSMLALKPKPAKPTTPKPFLHPTGGKQGEAAQLVLPIKGVQLKGKQWPREEEQLKEKEWPRLEEQLYDTAEVQETEDLYCDGYGL